jgi:hypothetical protein
MFLNSFHETQVLTAFLQEKRRQDLPLLIKKRPQWRETGL